MIPQHRAVQPLLMWFSSLFIFNRAKVESHGDAVEQIASWHRFKTSGDLFFELICVILLSMCSNLVASRRCQRVTWQCSCLTAMNRFVVIHFACFTSWMNVSTKYPLCRELFGSKTWP